MFSASADPRLTAVLCASLELQLGLPLLRLELLLNAACKFLKMYALEIQVNAAYTGPAWAAFSYRVAPSLQAAYKGHSAAHSLWVHLQFFGESKARLISTASPKGVQVGHPIGSTPQHFRQAATAHSMA